MDIGRSITTLHRKSQIFWANSLQEAGISASEYPVMLLLSYEDGITQDQIASGLSLHKSAVTRLVKNLEKKGYLERRQDASDLRCNRVYLTEAGKNQHNALASGQKRWVQIALQGIRLDEAEILQKWLDIMNFNMDTFLKGER